MPIPKQFETDSHGTIIAKPVVEWMSASFKGLGVILALHYVESAEELEGGKSKSIQFLFTPQLCLDMAEKITAQANIVLHAPPNEESGT
jgi:hypothetical protein